MPIRESGDWHEFTEAIAASVLSHEIGTVHREARIDVSGEPRESDMPAAPGLAPNDERVDLFVDSPETKVAFEVKVNPRDILAAASQAASHAGRMRAIFGDSTVAALAIKTDLSALMRLKTASPRTQSPHDAMRNIARAAVAKDAFDVVFVDATEDWSHDVYYSYKTGGKPRVGHAESIGAALGDYFRARGSELRVRPAKPRPTRPQRFLLVADEWSSSRGGVSSFNLQLARALLQRGREVVIALPEPAPEEVDKAQADGFGVAIPRTTIPGVTGPAALLRGIRRLDGVNSRADIVVGHGRILGPFAYALQEPGESSERSVRRLHIVHTQAEHLEHAKEFEGGGPRTRTAAERRNLELELARSADLVAGVGPRLSRSIADDLLGVDPTKAERVITINPGVLDWAGFHLSRPMPQQRTFLVLARAEDFVVKGIELAVRAVAKAASERPDYPTDIRLVIRGVPAEHSEIRDRIDRITGEYGFDHVHLREFTTSHTELAADLASASAVLMPSRTEGFGLSAFEAISFNVPVLISKESGLADLLRRTHDGNRPTARESLPVSGLEPALSAWTEAIGRILDDVEGSFVRARLLRSQLANLNLWDESIDAIDDAYGVL